MSSDVRTAWNTYLSQEMIAGPLVRVRTGPIRMVLDVGCGPESIGRTRFPQGTVLVSTDVREYPPVGVVCTALALPFRDEAFDLVLCLRVLQHLRDDEAALRELFRITRRGGAVILAIGNRRSWTLIEGRMTNPHWRSRIPYDYYHPYDAQEITRKLADVGFEEVDVCSVLFVPEAINRLPHPLVRAVLRSAAAMDRFASSLPGLRMAGTNLVAWGRRP